MFRQFHSAAIQLGLFRPSSILVDKTNRLRPSDLRPADSITHLTSDHWTPRPFEKSSMAELARLLVLNAPWALLMGLNGLRDYLCAWALWRLTPIVHIEGLREEELPRRAFLSSHHRRSLYEMDLCAQFLLSYNYNVLKVITDIKKPYPWLLQP